MGGWLYYIKTPLGRAFWDARRIKLPIFGSIAHKICLARFARTMASLVRSGVPILEVLAIVQNTVGNVIMEAAIKSAATDIERGRGNIHRLEQASRLPDHDHPHDDGRANKRAKSTRCWNGWPISWMKKSRTRSTG